MLASDDGTSGDAESEFSVYSSSSIAKSVAKVRVKNKKVEKIEVAEVAVVVEVVTVGYHWRRLRLHR